MEDRRDRSGIDYLWLSRHLEALSAPNRLELLRKLQLPHAMADITLRPVRRDAARSPERPLSRQAVGLHLRKLEELGLVHARAALREGRAVAEYQVHLPRLFALVEEFRKLALMHGSLDAGVATEAGAAPARIEARLPPGPALVLVAGPYEGRGFALAGPGPWLLGRDDAADVALPYDPFVSRRNTELRRGGPRLLARDLDGTRNGTRVNWRPLARGEDAPLAPGDVLGVGRSLLVVRGA